jgi:pimeloyl-ACP methyl ester carboxylesterase
MDVGLNTAGATRQQGYADAGAVHTYYEVAGEGEPLILLHGGLVGIDTFSAQTPVLAERHRVFLPERRGHGRTADVEGPITYAIMARDTAAFMEAVAVPRADLVGWSDGGIVALLVALHRPDLVGKLVLMGACASHEGYTAETRASFESVTRQDVSILEQMYAAASPDGPDHFGVVFDKLKPEWASEPNIGPAELGQVPAETLILIGDHDIVTVEHAAAMQRAMPHAQLAVVPGASHMAPMEKPELVNRLIEDFLSA